MMACDRFELKLALYVENDLPENERGGVETHLSGCLECQAWLARLRESQAALKNLANTEIREAFIESVRTSVWTQIAQEKAKPEARHGQRWALLAAAAVAVFSAAGLFAHRSAPPWFQQATHRERNWEGERPREPEDTPSPRLAGTLALPARNVPAHNDRDNATPGTVIRLITENPKVVILLLSDHEEVNDEQVKSL